MGKENLHFVVTYSSERLEKRCVDVHADDLSRAREALQAAEELALCAAEVDHLSHHADVLGVSEDGEDALVPAGRMLWSVAKRDLFPKIEFN